MASLGTNRFAYKLLGWPFRAQTIPTNFYIALVTNTTQDQDHNLMSDLTQIAAGNGYTSGGISLAKNSTDFDVWTEDDTNNRAFIQLKDIVWTASGGPIPASGSGAATAVLTDDNGTVTSREVYVEWDLGGARSVSSGQSLTLQNCEARITA